MRQLITRIDEELHERLKSRAAAEGRSVNALVVELLEAFVASANDRGRLGTRLAASGLRVVPRPRRRAPSRDAAIRATRGSGRVASEALAAERAAR